MYTRCSCKCHSGFESPLQPLLRRGTLPGQVPFATCVAPLVCRAATNPAPRCSRRSMQACAPDWFLSQITPSPWASTSFRPRHTRPTVAAFAPPSRSRVPPATTAIAGYSVLTKPSPPAKLRGSLQSPKAGCKRACSTHPSAESLPTAKPLLPLRRTSAAHIPISTVHHF